MRRSVSSSSKWAEIAFIEARNGLTYQLIYRKLSGMERDPKLKESFLRRANTEECYCKFWSKYLPGIQLHPDLLKVRLVTLLRYLFGASFIIKFLDKEEENTGKKYVLLRSLVPENDSKSLNRIIESEKKNEKAFAEQVKGSYVKYISFIVLGLADALVEIAGIHAGSLGIYNSTELTGFAGIIAGAAASIAMASAAFVQAKQGFKGSPALAAAYTGISYFVSAIILALPYFFTSNMTLALTTSIIFGFVIIGFVSWYNSIMSGSNCRNDFLELAGIMTGATIALFLLGVGIRHFFGITI